MFVGIAVASLAPHIGLAATAPKPTPAPEKVSARVSLADLNLYTSEGMSEARRRLKIMSERLCHRVVDSRRVAAQSLQEECARDALADALQRLHAVVQMARS
jgi:UrcA family protein